MPQNTAVSRACDKSLMFVPQASSTEASSASTYSRSHWKKKTKLTTCNNKIISKQLGSILHPPRFPAPPPPSLHATNIVLPTVVLKNKHTHTQNTAVCSRTTDRPTSTRWVVLAWSPRAYEFIWRQDTHEKPGKQKKKHRPKKTSMQ